MDIYYAWTYIYYVYIAAHLRPSGKSKYLTAYPGKSKDKF